MQVSQKTWMKQALGLSALAGTIFGASAQADQLDGPAAQLGISCYAADAQDDLQKMQTKRDIYVTYQVPSGRKLKALVTDPIGLLYRAELSEASDIDPEDQTLILDYETFMDNKAQIRILPGCDTEATLTITGAEGEILAEQKLICHANDSRC